MPGDLGGGGAASPVVEGRVAATLSRLGELDQAVDGWLAHRRKADALEQYATQLETIAAVLQRSTAAVAATVPSADGAVSAVYEHCRLADRRAVWVERVWRYFAERFDQRDGDGPAAACLRAADEVLWSCWRPCFATRPADPRPPLPGPVPLPYLDAVHAPEAFPASLVPADLAAVHADAPFVREHLQTLPVPTVRVPAAAAAEPWLLALVAHEAGHHLQFAAGLVAPFRDVVAAAVAEGGGDGDAVERWSGWSIELFADLASVALLGPWALWPIAELELRDTTRMTVPRGAYPPGVVRLRLLAAAITRLGLDPSPAWPSGLPPDGGDLPDLAFVDAVASAGLAIGCGGLDLAGWLDLRVEDMAPDGDVERWRRWFGGAALPDTAASLRAPRLVAAGAVAATADARRAPAPRRDALLAAVRAHAFDSVVALRAPGRRAADEAGPVGGDLGGLGEALAVLGDEELSASEGAA